MENEEFNWIARLGGLRDFRGVILGCIKAVLRLL